MARGTWHVALVVPCSLFLVPRWGVHGTRYTVGIVLRGGVRGTRYTVHGGNRTSWGRTRNTVHSTRIVF